MTYIAFALKEKRLLSFAVSLTFFSSFGQTFLISLFVPYYLEAFTLSNASFGTIYSLATLASALFLPYLGQLIDKIPLRYYTLAVAVSLSFACLLMAVSWHISILFSALVLLRLSGQGLTGHTAQTTMARYFDHERGKALSISSLGFPFGEAVLPLAIAGLLAFIHWRTAWVLIAILVLLILLPVTWFLLKGEKRVEETDSHNHEEKPTLSSSYSLIIKDSRIPFIIPAILLPPFWITGIFLYQVSSAEQLGWTTAIIASSFIFFAGARIGVGLIAGPLVDRFSAQKIFPFFLIPMISGFLLGALFSHPWIAFLYMGLTGATMGFAGTIKSALWAEMFGTEIIGTVRSLFSSLMVFSTAMSPFIMGWMLDTGITMPTILYIAFGTSIAGGLLSIRLLFER